MSKETVDVIVDGGKASAGAAMGKAFGPLGIRLGIHYHIPHPLP